MSDRGQMHPSDMAKGKRFCLSCARELEPSAMGLPYCKRCGGSQDAVAVPVRGEPANENAGPAVGESGAKKPYSTPTLTGPFPATARVREECRRATGPEGHRHFISPETIIACLANKIGIDPDQLALQWQVEDGEFTGVVLFRRLTREEKELLGSQD